ncbi:MAG: DUF6033 family protein [Clostridium sp.]|nr:DUF6033 family protein [Clostridium sp.]
MNMDIVSVNYQNILEKGKRELKKIENKGVSKAETLEDLRDTTGKSFRTADLEKLMKKYDPEAYAKYSKFAKEANGARTSSGLAFLSNWMDSVKKGLKDGTISSDGTVGKTGTSESKLSSKAQDFLKNLRKKYGDYDFFVGDGTDNLKALAKSGTKEFSVIFSSAELERMANDENYAKEKLKGMEHAVKMSKEINKQFGFESSFGKDGVAITKMGIVLNEDGTTSFFAEMEKSSAKSRENLERIREEKRTKQKEEEKRTESKEKELSDYAKRNDNIKHVSIQADSMDELLEKMKSVDWDVVKAEEIQNSGTKYDFSI